MSENFVLTVSPQPYHLDSRAQIWEKIPIAPFYHLDSRAQIPGFWNPNGKMVQLGFSLIKNRDPRGAGLVPTGLYLLLPVIRINLQVLAGTTNTVCDRRVNLLVYSLSLHRHSYIGFKLAFASSIHNKQTSVLAGSGGMIVLWLNRVYLETRELNPWGSILSRKNWFGRCLFGCLMCVQQNFIYPMRHACEDIVFPWQPSPPP